MIFHIFKCISGFILLLFFSELFAYLVLLTLVDMYGRKINLDQTQNNVQEHHQEQSKAPLEHIDHTVFTVCCCSLQEYPESFFGLQFVRACLLTTSKCILQLYFFGRCRRTEELQPSLA